MGSLNYKISPAWNVYLSAGRGFETPTINELSYRPDGQTGLNIGLQPSTSDTVELGSKLRLGNGTVSAALFQTDTDNELVVAESSGGRTSYANAGKTRRRGPELALDQEFALDWRLHMARRCWTPPTAAICAAKPFVPQPRPFPPAITCRASRATWATPRWPLRRRKAGMPARSCAT